MMGQDTGERARLEEVAGRLRDRFPTYPRRHLYVLMSVGAIDAADRTVLSTVFEDIKEAFDVSDSRLGVLTAAYSVVATLSVIPFGWIADRWNRVRLIALGFIPWSLAMILTGGAQSFVMMFGARMFLGTIEATNGPSTPSLIGDYYPVRERGRIMGIYSVGNLLGSLLGFAMGGLLATVFGWRATFFIFGGLGFLCGALVIKLLPEPDRGVPDALHRVEQALEELEADEAAASRGEAPIERHTEELREHSGLDYRHLTVGQATREILRVKTMWFMFVAGAIGEFFMSGISTWAPTYFRRYHDLGAGAAGGLVATLALSVVGGVVVASRAGDRMLADGHPERRLVLAGGASVVGFVAVLFSFSIDNLVVVTPFFLLTGFCIGVPMPLLQTVYLDTLVAHLRGRASAVRSVLRVVGTALAPLLFGFLSDTYTLRTALLVTAPFMLVAGLITALGARTYRRDMQFAQAESVRQHEIELADDHGVDPDEVVADVLGVLDDG